MMITDEKPPFDPTLDADNPYITEIPERFVAETSEDFEADWAFHIEATFDPDLESYYADATHAQWG